MGRGDRRRPWRGGLSRDQRILVRPHHRNHPASADAFLHRGQRLRHFGPVNLPDAGRRHRGELGQLQRTTCPLRGRRRAVRGGATGQGWHGSRPDYTGALPAAPDRPSPAGSQLPGHTDLQVRGDRGRRMGARSPAPAEGLSRTSLDGRGGMGSVRRASQLDGGNRAGER